MGRRSCESCLAGLNMVFKKAIRKDLFLQMTLSQWLTIVIGTQAGLKDVVGLQLLILLIESFHIALNHKLGSGRT